jgi:hypothetical protein
MRGTIRSLPRSPTSISNSIAGFFAAVALGTSLNLFYVSQPELPGSGVSHWGWDNGIGNVQCAASRSSSNLTASWPMSISA